MQAATITQGNLFGDDTVIPVKTKQYRSMKFKTLTSPQEQFLLGVEAALGFKRVNDRSGKEVLDLTGQPLLRLNRRKSFRGQYKASKVNGFLREALIISCQNSALAQIAPLFEEHENERLVREGLSLLTHRLRRMQGDDCPKMITHVFVEHYVQQDLLMNERTGETLRNNEKKANAEARRRAAGVQARNFRKNRTVHEVEAEQPSTLSVEQEGVPSRIKLSVDRLLGKGYAANEAYASDDDPDLDRKTDDSFILNED